MKKKYFLYGLSSFLVAHIGFTWAFVSINGFSWGLISLFILLLAFIAYFGFLKKYLKKYTLPVIIYMLAIIVMSWQAIELLRFNHDLVFIGIATASILFFISDGLIAYKKFVKPFRSVEVFILSTYWIAIYVFSIAGLFITNP